MGLEGTRFYCLLTSIYSVRSCALRRFTHLLTIDRNQISTHVLLIGVENRMSKPHSPSLYLASSRNALRISPEEYWARPTPPVHHVLVVRRRHRFRMFVDTSQQRLTTSSEFATRSRHPRPLHQLCCSTSGPWISVKLHDFCICIFSSRATLGWIEDLCMNSSQPL